MFSVLQCTNTVDKFVINKSIIICGLLAANAVYIYQDLKDTN